MDAYPIDSNDPSVIKLLKCWLPLELSYSFAMRGASFYDQNFPMSYILLLMPYLRFQQENNKLFALLISNFRATYFPLYSSNPPYSMQVVLSSGLIEWEYVVVIVVNAL